MAQSHLINMSAELWETSVNLRWEGSINVLTRIEHASLLNQAPDQ